MLSKDPNIFVNGKSKVDLATHTTDYNYNKHYKDEEHSIKKLNKANKDLNNLQYKLFASEKHAVLIILQAIDAAGKDGILKHVIRGINPQGCNAYSFKQPTKEELKHDWMWRHYKALPAYGKIGIFNRSYYENVIITKVHPELILKENIPNIENTNQVDDAFWENRYQDIRNFEDMLQRNGTIILKFFLHISKEEQGKRFISRIDKKNKNWKISEADIKEREHWEDYQKAFQDMINKTATKTNPWYIIPSNSKSYSRAAVGKILVERLSELDLKTPKLNEKTKNQLSAIRSSLQTSIKKPKD